MSDLETELEVTETGEEVEIEVEPGPAAALGQIVLYRIGANDDETLRPAIVNRVWDDEMGGVGLHIFAEPGDVPFAYGSAVRADSIIGYYVIRAYFGTDVGSWRFAD